MQIQELARKLGKDETETRILIDKFWSEGERGIIGTPEELAESFSPALPLFPPLRGAFKAGREAREGKRVFMSSNGHKRWMKV